MQQQLKHMFFTLFDDSDLGEKTFSLYWKAIGVLCQIEDVFGVRRESEMYENSNIYFSGQRPNDFAMW